MQATGLLRGAALLALGPAMFAIWYLTGLPGPLSPFDPFTAPSTAADRVVLAGALEPGREDDIHAIRIAALKTAQHRLAPPPRVSPRTPTPTPSERVASPVPQAPLPATTVAATAHTPPTDDRSSATTSGVDTTTTPSAGGSTTTTPSPPAAQSPPALPAVTLPATPSVQVQPPPVTLPPLPGQSHTTTVQLPPIQVPTVQVPPIKPHLP